MTYAEKIEQQKERAGARADRRRDWADSRRRAGSSGGIEAWTIGSAWVYNTAMRKPVTDRPQRFGGARLDIHLPVVLKVALAHAAAERRVSLGEVVIEALRHHPDVARWGQAADAGQLKEGRADDATGPAGPSGDDGDGS